jgi:predicted nucleotidyltransferase
MSKDLLRNAKFKYEIKKFYRKHKNWIVDIVLFGSIVRGKREPEDLDLLIIFKEKENIDLSYELRKKLEKIGFKPEITMRTLKNVFAPTFLPRESILAEGYSFALNRKISEAFGFKSFTLFTYSLKGFSPSKRMLFHYALNGRNDKKGVLEELKGVKLANTAILVSSDKSEEFEDFLNYWNVKHKRVQILFPDRAIAYREFELK